MDAFAPWSGDTRQICTAQERAALNVRRSKCIPSITLSLDLKLKVASIRQGSPS